MRKLVLAAFLALSSCAAAPAFAQQCVTAERVLDQIEAAKPAGLQVVTFAREDAAKVMDVLTDGEPLPDGFKPDAVIMVSGDRAAMLLFVEGDRICRTLTITLKAALSLEQAVRGRVV